MIEEKRLDALTDSVARLKEHTLSGFERHLHQMARLEGIEKEISLVRETVKLDMSTIDHALEERMAKVEREAFDLQTELQNHATRKTAENDPHHKRGK